MKNISRRFTQSLMLALLVAGGRSALAADSQFGMIGLAGGQTLRLTVIAYPPTPCVAQIGFLTRTGAIPGPDPVKTVNLQPGMSDFVDLHAASLNLAQGARMEFQPFVTPQPDPGVSACVATVELYTSSTGATVVAVPQPEPSMPNLAPVFGPMGLTSGEVMRLNVNAFPPTPCFAQIGFVAPNGTRPIPAKTVTVQPGTGDFLDLHSAVLALQPGERLELLPAVMMLPGPNGSSACQATVEIYNHSTGRTRSMLNPQPLPP